MSIVDSLEIIGHTVALRAEILVGDSADVSLAAYLGKLKLALVIVYTQRRELGGHIFEHIVKGAFYNELITDNSRSVALAVRKA